MEERGGAPPSPGTIVSLSLPLHSDSLRLAVCRGAIVGDNVVVATDDGASVPVSVRDGESSFASS